MIAVEAIDKFRADIPYQAGEHLWIYAAVFRTKFPRDQQVLLDKENLLAIVGPGCYWCEQMYSRELATKPCKRTTE